MMMLQHSCLVRQILTIHRHFSSISTASKVPVRALFLGRGASDQLVGDGGRLGFVHENPAFHPTPNPFLDSVHSIALGGIRAMAVSVHWGMYHRELFPRLVEGSWDGKTRHISTTGIHSSAITASEKMHEEIKELLPIRKGLLNQTSSYLAMYRLPRTLVHILSFACCHSSGSYYGNRGSLYLGLRRRRWQAFPVPVAAVSCDDFFRMVLAEEGQIAGGGYHCLALTGKVTPERHDEGQVLSWGFDGHCQLGHSSIQCQKIPAVIDALADQHAIHVTCGGSSLAAITGKSRHDLELHLCAPDVTAVCCLNKYFFKEKLS
ncbi:hypothetical protein POTOM_039238 [Populus tomentosa]|uniref:Uncharacterized protein n=1 Tax=Populus tomentosa TaxID=118781 RepID=A0A8X7YRI0_POPTO|nr:hypothetical protein POTOM_039238 [Populus tomentosa]